MQKGEGAQDPPGSPFQQPAGKEQLCSSAECGPFYFPLAQAANSALGKDCGLEAQSPLEGGKPASRDQPRATF